MENITTPSFRQWLVMVDKVAQAKTGLSIHDLPDATWRDYFDDELTPSEAWDCAIEDGILD
jgi:hypothetical protein